MGTSSMLQRFIISTCGHMSSHVPTIVPFRAPPPANMTNNNCTLQGAPFSHMEGGLQMSESLRM